MSESSESESEREQCEIKSGCSESRKVQHNSCGSRSVIDSSSDSDTSDFEYYENNVERLPYDFAALQDIVLQLCDQFDLRFVVSNKRARQIMMMYDVCPLAGTELGKYIGGDVVAVALSSLRREARFVALSMRYVWDNVKSGFGEVCVFVYEHLVDYGLKNYQAAAEFLLHNKHLGSHLADIVSKLMSVVMGFPVTPMKQ